MEIKMKLIGTALLALLSVGVLSALPAEKKSPLPDHAASEMAELNAAAEHEIPREPETTWTALDGILTVSVQQPEYPTGTEEITIILQNSSSGEAMYGENYSMEKYIDGSWVNISGNLSFNAVGLILSEHNLRTMTINTALFPSPLGVGLYRIIGTTLSYTGETGLTTTTTDCYVVEFLVTEDAPTPTDIDLNISDCWIPAYQVIGKNEFHFSMKGPYAAGLQCTTEAQQDILVINIYNRSTGEKLTASPFQFQASYPQDIHEGTQGEILVESQGQMYCIDVVDGQVTVVPSEEVYDERIPHTPRTSTETFSGEISIAMEAPSYPVGTESIAFTLTNNTQHDVTTESFLPCSELYNWEHNNCFRRLPEGISPELELAQDPELIELKAGERKTFTLDLSQWYISEYTEEGQEIQAALGRSLYTMSFSRRTFSFSDGSTITARLSIEFVLE